MAYRTNGYENGRVIKNADLKVTFRDVNSREIESVKVMTNGMGMVSGSFHIPDNILPGRATIQIGETYNEFSNSRQINIESFRQPKFDVQLDNPVFAPEFDREFEISGRAVSFTDVPVEGATVKWNAGISSYIIHPFFTRDGNNVVRIGSGELVTGQDPRQQYPAWWHAHQYPRWRLHDFSRRCASGYW